MKHFRRLLVLVALLLLQLRPVSAHVAIQEMTEEAKSFIASLPPSLKEKAVVEFKSEQRRDWHYVPRERPGVLLKELSKEQQDGLHSLLDAALSRQGFVKTSSILAMEQVLYDLENKSAMRDPGLYSILFFGEPSETGTWGWRFEGHHLSINVTMVDGQFVAGTPIFMGSNPAEVKTGPRKGMRPLGPEEDLGRELVNSLDDIQRQSAIFSEKAPREIITRAARKVKPLEQQGLSFSEMNRQQGELLLKLMREYLYRYRPEIADAAWKKAKEAGFENIYFAWAGGTEKGQGHYYRVQGPTFLLEYDNTQNDANHVHTVWRDFENDFGADLLKQHYENDEH